MKRTKCLLRVHQYRSADYSDRRSPRIIRHVFGHDQRVIPCVQSTFSRLIRKCSNGPCALPDDADANVHMHAWPKQDKQSRAKLVLWNVDRLSQGGSHSSRSRTNTACGWRDYSFFQTFIPNGSVCVPSPETPQEHFREFVKARGCDIPGR